jgi:hypothetical protein
VIGVPARSFEDSAGAVWEVFEVQRSSHKAEAVSPGLERGWLAFSSGSRKRRLAPFPKEWQTADAAELERLCGMARVAHAARLARLTQAPTPADGANVTVAPRTHVPRIRPPRASRPAASVNELPIVATASNGDSVESTVRAFAHEARSRGLPVIEAMVQLKGLLAPIYTDATSAARDLRAVRRWFVEAYYFDGATPAGAADQSR